MKMYEEKGYVIPKQFDKKGRLSVIYGTKITVDVLDLPHSSTVKVKVICDYCNHEHEKEYGQYNQSRKISNTSKDACKKCAKFKTAEGRFRYTFEDVLNEFEKSNMEVLITSEDYIEANQHIPYRCKTCNHKSTLALSNLLLGRRCKKCKMKINADKQRYSYEYIKEYFKKQDCILLTNEYVNNGQILDYICDCGDIGHTRFHRFQAGDRCKTCRYKKVSKSKLSSFDEVKNIFESAGCTLVSSEYTSKCKLEYICICGNRDKKTLAKFKGGQRCKECAMKARKEKLKTDYIVVEETFANDGCKLLTKEYRNMSQILAFICSCGNKSSVALSAFKMGARCEICTPTIRDSGRARYTEEYNNWSKKVLMRDDYTCQYCLKKGDKLHAHHKDGYHWCTNRRYDLSNGATLCSACHKDFHDTYGRKNNTEQQFSEWIKSKYKLNCLYELEEEQHEQF